MKQRRVCGEPQASRPPANPLRGLVDARTAFRSLGVSKPSFYRWVRQGWLLPITREPVLLFREEDVDAFRARYLTGA